jgi:hypothetical protein
MPVRAGATPQRLVADEPHNKRPPPHWLLPVHAMDHGSLTGDRGFECVFLQRGVRREPDFSEAVQIVRTIDMARACVKVGIANRAY